MSVTADIFYITEVYI